MKAVDIDIPMKFKQQQYQQAEILKKYLGLDKFKKNYTIIHW